MRSKVQQITMVLLLTILLAPGLMQAQTPARHNDQPNHQRPRASASLNDPAAGSFCAVWNLLSTFFKTGIGLDPSGTPPPPAGNTSSTSGDTGTQLDPSGTPK